MTQQIAGIDEAGRGPVIGPLVITGIVIEPSKEDALIEWGVRDSKQLTPRRREALQLRIQQIASQVEVLEISAKEIDAQRQQGRTLNILEAQWMAQVLNRLNWDIAYVDASDVDAKRYGRQISVQLKTKNKVVSEHKADSAYPVVAAASVLAKVRRDQRIRELHRNYGDFGSGYPNDPKTRKFLSDWIKTHSTFPDIVRKTWETARSIRAANRQQTFKD
ncbi:MAG: ribonuclease HII, partial [Candidatus Hermodarchaeia archaeon]